ncbi:MAG: hypothetical protein KDA24_03915 [Deltaproteobacteria bacterium]|nr:hypothetical protein [Deltaproteobacteria bacterium]
MKWPLALLLAPTLLLAGMSPVDDTPPPTGSVNLEETLLSTWRASIQGAEWRSPTTVERESLQEVTGALLAGANSCDGGLLADAERRLSAIDFTLTVLPSTPRVLLVHEKDENRGAGVFAIRCGPARPVVWQAPHAFFDRWTGRIVRRVFIESGVRAAFWNTVHRHRSWAGEDPNDDVHPADVTREYGSTFHAVTVAVAAADPALRFVQVHGFDATERGMNIILSTGQREEPPLALARSLSKDYAPVGAFGEDTDILGATGNVQGKALSRTPGRFLHLELALDLRESLAEDPARRSNFLSLLEAGGW